MGIPSYYKRLLDTVSGILSKTHPGAVDWLWMDFNCLIYHCLRRKTTAVYPGHDGRIEWEKQFIESILEYVQNIVKEVNPKRGIYLAIDGVVPMAKMKQQRLRRFKSAWLVTNGLAEPGKTSWDTNSITPGTEFMNKLAKRLGEYCDKKSGKVRWRISSSNEPGEGEHKIMEQWRTGDYTGNHAIYGLDADLIVLSLLNKSSTDAVWLFREQIEMGTILLDTDGEEVYSWFSIDKLGEHLQTQIGERTLQEYCFAMSILGNDFLPSSLSFKMREDGHDALLECLCTLRSQLLNEKGEIDENGLYELFGWLASSEKERISRFIGKKLSIGRNYTELTIGDNNWPLSEKVEECLITGYGPKGILRENWQDIYHKKWLENTDKLTICKEYIYGIHWIWSYYKGQMNNVCFNWCYHWSLPPLWNWIIDYRKPIHFPERILVRRDDILPTEQLCLVLPIDSWWLLGQKKERQLITRAPWLFPESFSFGSIGKRYFWECEPEIPVPTIAQVKAILA